MARRLLVTRHAEAECNATETINNDPTVDCALTARGREQALAIGRLVRDESIDLCVTTRFPRTQETAARALENRDIPRVIMGELDDPPQAGFEGRPLRDYFDWLTERDWSERPPGGGESQLQSVARYARGWRSVAERPEDTIFVVGHAFPISVARTLATGEGPLLRRKYEMEVQLARLYEIDPSDVLGGIEMLERELGEQGIRV